MLDMTTILPPNYSYVFKFEQAYDHGNAIKWLSQNYNAHFYCIALYLLLVFGIKHLMRNRPAFKLRRMLSIWSGTLAAFSVVGMSRTAPELIMLVTQHSLYDSVCTYLIEDRVAGFWTYMFILSKLPELGDTIFIVLRKQPLTFLHCYHHISVLFFTWFSYRHTSASTRWFVVMNYTVHSIMYSYYALKAKGFRIPRQMAMVITGLQVIQMSVGFAVNVCVMYFILTGVNECDVAKANIKVGLLIYFTYLILFSNFFYRSYWIDNKMVEKTTAKTK